jgi:hypothetical protein
MYLADKVLETEFDKFRELQPPELFAIFQQTELEHLQRKILDIQTSQERRKSMIDFSRIISFIKAFQGFAATFRLTPEQTACIWGPVKYVLQVSTFHRFLSNICICAVQ